MVEKSIVVLPLVWTFAASPSHSRFKISQKNLPLTFWPGGTNSLWTMHWMSKKKFNMDLKLLRTWRAFFGRGEFGNFHCDDYCSVSGSYQYNLLSSLVMTLEMKLRSSLACCLSSLQPETRWAFWSSLSSLCTNLAKIRLMYKLFDKTRWTVPYDSPTIPQTSWIVCLRSARIASWTFAILSGVVLVDGRPERSSSSTDFPSSLKRLYRKKFCFGSRLYLRRLLQRSLGFWSSFV